MIVKVNTAKDLSAVIRDSRKSRGWTQANLAKRIGVYQGDISNYVRILMFSIADSG